MTQPDQFPVQAEVPQSAYDQILGSLTERLAERDQQELDAEQQRLITITNGYQPTNMAGDVRAGGINYYESVRRGASSYNQEVITLTHAYRERWGGADTEPDQFGRVFDRVAGDMHGRDATGRAYDIVDASFSPGTQELDDPTRVEDPEFAEKAAMTVNVLLNAGVYKFLQWGNGDQLATAIGLMQEYAQRIPGFDLYAVLPQAKGAILTARAALLIDDRTKPNFQYAHPERRHLFGVTHSALEGLRVAEAHLALQSVEGI